MHADILKVMTETVSVASILHTMLPPWEVLADYPRAQRGYKLFVYIVGYVALNGRSTVYPGLSTRNGQQPSSTSLQAAGVDSAVIIETGKPK